MTRAAFFASLFSPFLAAPPRAEREEDVEVLSAWTDPDSGDIIALVSIKKSAPKPDPGLYS